MRPGFQRSTAMQDKALPFHWKNSPALAAESGLADTVSREFARIYRRPPRHDAGRNGGLLADARTSMAG